MKEFDFSSETVAVTGTGHGFGRANAQSFAALGARVIASIGSRRLGEAQDIANAVLFLASPKANDINGQVLSVDGGQ